jgi:hypothetical protein
MWAATTSQGTTAWRKESHNALRNGLLLRYLLYVWNRVPVDSTYLHVDGLRFNVYVDVSSVWHFESQLYSGSVIGAK